MKFDQNLIEKYFSGETSADEFFGLNSTIKHRIKLSDGCFIGASSFVSESHDVPVKLIPRSSKPIPK